MVVGGGGGERLGGVSKPDLVFAGGRLIDRVCGALLEACGAGCVAVVPPAVRVPDGVLRTLEDPPGGGPLAGIDAGLSALGAPADAWVVVVSVDCPGIADVLAALLDEPLGDRCEGRILRGGGACAAWGCGGCCAPSRSSGWTWAPTCVGTSIRPRMWPGGVLASPHDLSVMPRWV